MANNSITHIFPLILCLSGLPASRAGDLWRRLQSSNICCRLLWKSSVSVCALKWSSATDDDDYEMSRAELCEQTSLAPLADSAVRAIGFLSATILYGRDYEKVQQSPIGWPPVKGLLVKGRLVACASRQMAPARANNRARETRTAQARNTFVRSFVCSLVRSRGGNSLLMRERQHGKLEQQQASLQIFLVLDRINIVSSKVR